MTIKMPSKIRILAFDIDIEDWNPHDARGKFGEFCTLSSLIKIDFSAEKTQVLDTLIHEINHAVYWAYHIEDDDKEERVVSIFTSAWVQIYRDNPDLIEFIGSVFKQNDA